ncbi:MAG TPA: prephenate dehydrogenase/arogenate dehydrogenase family protein [Longimicrobiales bacterium]|nr:prephenate dehydrogenase/arogenate dehydrogenase family protein [Longimicrobiales bacterium]
MHDPGEAPMDALSALRERLAGVDGELVALLARRAELSARIADAKDAAGLPTRDFRQEREVLERARAAALDLGADPDLAEAAVLLLVRDSLTVQERARVAAAGGGDGRRALVIGGHGRMGLWFSRFLASQGFRVEVADPASPPAGSEWPHRARWEDGRVDHEVVVVAAPLAASARILRELAGRAPPGLVFDIGSLKTPLRGGLEELRAAGVRIASIHPMFGPDTRLLSGRHVIFADAGVPEATAAAGALFDATMATRVEMGLEEHDRLIAYVLGLSHALNVAFFTALAGSGEDAPRLAELSSTTFDAQLDVAALVACDNPALYFEIQHLNEFGMEPLDALADAVDRVREAVARGDGEAFRRLMEAGRSYLSARGSAPAASR